MNKIKLFLITFLFITLSSFIFLYTTKDGCQNCSQLKTGSFNYIAYNKLPESLFSDIQSKLEANQERLLIDFHLDSMPRITIKIWSNVDEYLAEQEKAFGIRYPGSRGYIVSDPKEIRLLYTHGDTKNIALHELVHLLTLEVNPKFGNNPRWLWEAIAIYKSERSWKYANKPEQIEDRFEMMSNELNSDFNQSGAIYELGYTIGEYIEYKWGNEAFIVLIHSHGDFSELTSSPFNEIISDWQSFVKARYFE
ncbi:hypothetical protein [Agaribacterium sp. ZY112]|uniref:hypothetical protein n=1 Tax=Agaribacterium sp. ZY112 TaxID=3233574 RepID=UPI003523AFD2